jgi:hypothetical protein
LSINGEICINSLSDLWLLTELGIHQKLYNWNTGKDMTHWITGENLRQFWKISEKTLLDYVRKGLQPHDDQGLPIPPKYVKDLRSTLKKEYRSKPSEMAMKTCHAALWY